MNAFRVTFRLARMTLRMFSRSARLALFPSLLAASVLGVSALCFTKSFISFSLAGSGYDLFLNASANGSPPRAWWAEPSALNRVVRPLLIVTIPLLTILFNTALMCTVLDALRGRSISLRRGWRNTIRKFSQISIWAMTSGSILWLLNCAIPAFRINFGNTYGLGVHHIPLTGAVGHFLSLGWSLASFFVIPILLFEETPLQACLRRSAQLLMATWKQQATFHLLVLPLLAIPLAALLAPAFFVQSDLASEILARVVAFSWIAVLAGFESVFCALLYSYAITGMPPDEFSSVHRAPALTKPS